MQNKWPGNCVYIIAFCNDFQCFSNLTAVRAKQLMSFFLRFLIQDFWCHISKSRCISSIGNKNMVKYGFFSINIITEKIDSRLRIILWYSAPLFVVTNIILLTNGNPFSQLLDFLASLTLVTLLNSSVLLEKLFHSSSCFLSQRCCFDLINFSWICP